MIDLYLRAESEAALIAALPMFREDGHWITASHAHALDVIGTFYTPVELDADGKIVGGGEALPGYHANLRLIDEGLADQIPAEIIVTPETPMRVWADQLGGGNADA